MRSDFVVGCVESDCAGVGEVVVAESVARIVAGYFHFACSADSAAATFADAAESAAFGSAATPDR